MTGLIDRIQWMSPSLPLTMVTHMFLLFILIVSLVHPGSTYSGGSYQLAELSPESSRYVDIDLMRSEPSGSSPLMRVRRSEDESALKYKKNPTKKPTLLTKNKPNYSITKTTVSSTVTGEVVGVSASETSASHSLPLAATSLGANAMTTTESSFFPPEDATLPPNATKEEDHHQYYNSTLLTNGVEAMKHWMDGSTAGMQHEMLSNSHRRAATVQLKFPFPFYGHPIKNVTIATGGFLYLGDAVHSWLAATQYIAPLMANFDTSISNTSSINYVNNETHFIVQWKDVELQDQTPPGNFSFQVTLHLNGDIVFVYKDLPINITDIPDQKHPVKVGISDAYLIERTIFFIRRKTIFEYHRADFKKQNIANHTAIYFAALPTCVSFTSCDSCLDATVAFECKWCDAAARCSDGYDRHRQDWLTKKCDTEHHSKDMTVGRCVVKPTTPSPPTTISPFNPEGDNLIPGSSSHTAKDERKEGPSGGASAGSAIGVLFMLFVAITTGLGMWVFYAYKNPQTGAGQFLIKYRPAEWRWNNGGDTRHNEL